MLDDAADLTFVPTILDRQALEALEVDGRIEAENGLWVVLRYPAMPKKGWRWCEYTLLIGHPKLVQMVELKSKVAVLSYLDQVEEWRQQGFKPS